jgi:lipopolysaccharide export system protein LptC
MLMALGNSASLYGAADDKSKSRDANAESEEGNRESAKGKTSGTVSSMQTLDILALNQESTGIFLPEFDDNGRQSGKITAESAIRTSDDVLDLKNMRIEMPNEAGGNITIDLPAATFNLKTSMLVGTRDVVITRIDFVLTGDRLEFNTKTRESVLLGNIKMVLHEKISDEQNDAAR